MRTVLIGHDGEMKGAVFRIIATINDELVEKGEGMRYSQLMGGHDLYELQCLDMEK